MSQSVVSSDVVVPLLIGGEEVLTSRSFDVITPSTNTTCWKASVANESNAVKAIESASAAFPAWSKTKPSVRVQILQTAASILEANIETNAKYMMVEMGADQGAAQFFVLPSAIALLRDIAARISSVVGTVPVPAANGQSAMVWKEPYGVTVGIVPWNAPYFFGIRSAATAIATGNTTILKASEQTPRCYWALGRALAEAGLPKGVFNLLNCPPEAAPQITSTLIEHPTVKKIDFTGSATVGRQIAAKCGQNLKPCMLELGGKNSSIVLADADLEKAAQACLAGAFLNSGQICMATDRIIVHAGVASAFQGALQAGIAAMMSSSEGPPKVVSAKSKARLGKLISGALASGASLVAGNMPADDQQSPAGDNAANFSPTILSDVSQDMQVWTDETFGPIASLRIVNTDEEAVQVANSTGYGLVASIFTRDLRKAFSLARQIETGAVHINSMTVHDEAALPFGGVKNSGWGRFNSTAGMDEFLVTKSVTWDD